MAITLSDETRKHPLASLKRFCAENLDAEVSELQAIGLLDCFLREMGRSVSNAVAADAHGSVRSRLEYVEGTCFESELGDWLGSSSVRRQWTAGRRPLRDRCS